jgi:hypothetical protein
MSHERERDTCAVTAEAEPIGDLIETYEQTALRWEELQPDASAANAVFEENHSIYRRLRGRDEGRSCITRLMNHESEAVRLLAATHSLAWEPDTATAVLEAIEHGDGPKSVDAKWTLRSYRTGRLNLDW